MTKGDRNHRNILQNILVTGTKDENPRPHYEDILPNAVLDTCGRSGIQNTPEGKYPFYLKENQWARQEGKNVVLCTPAHSQSINHVIQQYNLAKGECPIITLRPIAWKSAVKEILWIYQKQSNKLSDLHEMGIHYWDQWDIGDGTIGCRYGATVKRHHLMEKLLEGLKKDPFGRRHIMCMWQEDDFSDETGGTTKGLNPCCYETIWNVRKEKNGRLYLDMLLNQRSSDYIVSNCINEMQYVALQMMVARHCGMEPGMFTHVSENVQIYDRHRKQAMELIGRSSITDVNPRFVLKEGCTDFYQFTVDDFELLGYPAEKIRKENPQMHFPMAI